MRTWTQARPGSIHEHLVAGVGDPGDALRAAIQDATVKHGPQADWLCQATHHPEEDYLGGPLSHGRCNCLTTGYKDYASQAQRARTGHPLPKCAGSQGALQFRTVVGMGPAHPSVDIAPLQDQPLQWAIEGVSLDAHGHRGPGHGHPMAVSFDHPGSLIPYAMR